MSSRHLANAAVVAAALIAAAATGTGAHAAIQTATFDFQAIADGGGFTNTNDVGQTGDEGGWDGVVGGAGLGIKSNGISVFGTASGNDGSGNTSQSHAYFDENSAGLGACGTLDSNGNCQPANDDNVGSVGGTDNADGASFETLTLTFDRIVGADALTFAGEGHGTFGGAVKINGILFDDADAGTFVDNGSDSSSLSAASLALLNPSSIFSFVYVPVGTISPTDEFYIDSITVSTIPLPASIFLLLGAVGGLGFVGRNRTKTA